MPRKKGGGRRKPRPLETRIVRIETPAGVTGAKYFRGLMRATKSGELPDGWDVSLMWRNPTTKAGRSKDWQEGEFTAVLENSSDGFRTAVQNTIRKYAGDLLKRPEPAKKKTPAKKPPAKKSVPEKRKAASEKRSEASRKGWVTRRKNAAKKKGKKR